MASSSLSLDRQAALATLADDLGRIFGVRLQALVAYGARRRASDEEPLHTLALVERVEFDDLAACVPLTDGWARLDLAVPFIISRDEFQRTLDVFPLEYQAIIDDHAVVVGTDPFHSIHVAEGDLRREIEFHAKSHLIHLREGFLEAGRSAAAVARLIASSAPAFRSLLTHIAALDGRAAGSDEELADGTGRAMGLEPALVQEVLATPRSGTALGEPAALLQRYVAAAETVWRYVDRWRSR